MLFHWTKFHFVLTDLKAISFSFVKYNSLTLSLNSYYNSDSFLNNFVKYNPFKVKKFLKGDNFR